MTAARVLVLYAGGTIGMEASGEGLRPMPDFAERLAPMLAADKAFFGLAGRAHDRLFCRACSIS